MTATGWTLTAGLVMTALLGAGSLSPSEPATCAPAGERPFVMQTGPTPTRAGTCASSPTRGPIDKPLNIGDPVRRVPTGDVEESPTWS